MFYDLLSNIYHMKPKKKEKKKKSRNLLRKFSKILKIFEFWLLNFFQPAAYIHFAYNALTKREKNENPIGSAQTAGTVVNAFMHSEVEKKSIT